VPSPTDGRSKLLHLTEHGRAVYEPLDRRSREEVGDMLSRFGESDQLRMLDAMRTIRELLDAESGMKYAQPFVLRAHRLATWRGSRAVTAKSTKPTRAGTAALKRWSARSAKISNAISIPRWSIAGSPR
jgi:hypothetical protein